LCIQRLRDLCIINESKGEGQMTMNEDKSESGTRIPEQGQRIYLPLDKREGETRQQANERVAAELLLAIELQEVDRKAVENLRATGHTEAEIEELGRLY
jgi:hypothetical protein